MDASSVRWLSKNVFQLWEGGFRVRTMYLATVLSATTYPNRDKFRLNPWCAPGRILARHAANEFSNLGVDFGAARIFGLRFPAPVELESPQVPSDDRFWLNDNQYGAPIV